MTLNRYARKSDTAQPAIVKELRRLGVEVTVIGKPVDLLCRLPEWPVNRYSLVEIKTPTKTGKIVKRKDQEAQEYFCREYGIPRLTTTEQVYEYLKSR